MKPLEIDITIPAWTEQALCAQTDPELWFPKKGASITEARKVCAACPVVSECLDYSLEHDMRHGVWGGLSELDRRIVRAERKAAA